MERLYYKEIWDFIYQFNKMILLSGPRQSGKTTFSKIIQTSFSNSMYYNYDIIENKQKILTDIYFYEKINLRDSTKPLIILDEFHKYPDWKNYLKNIFDRDGERFQFFVTGSGRLDIFQKGGDSLAGRYLMFRLWPFTISELSKSNLTFDDFFNNPLSIPDIKKGNQNYWNNLSQFSGFPDPFLKQNKQFYSIWSNNYKKQLLYEDIRELSGIKKVENIDLLYSLIPSKIGSPLSMAKLSGQLKVSFDSIKSWLNLFEMFYLIFSISPWSNKIARAISKEKKVYLYDYGYLTDKSYKFENMVALELWKVVNNWNDLGLGNFSLHYIRNRDKEEVDFLIAGNNKPFIIIETKLNDEQPSKSLLKFQNALNVPAVQLLNKNGICKLLSNNKNKILVITANRWLSQIP